MLDLSFAALACCAANLLAQAAAVYPLFLIPMLIAAGSLLALAEEYGRHAR